VSDDEPGTVVEAGYDRVAEDYAGLEREGHEWPRLRRLRELLSEVPAGGTVLDVGCGNGIPAMRAIQERHTGVGVDVSGVQIDLARKNVPDGHFIQSGIMDLDFPADSFDAIVAFYAVEHIPREEHAELFRRFHRWLRPGGRLVFTLEPYDEPGHTGEWLGVPMFLSFFDPDTTAQVLADAGLVVADRRVESQVEGDRAIDYIWWTATKDAAG
jgi:cyclopropane fatty-acyl-phospholipid synthase-like methyltransferase